MKNLRTISIDHQKVGHQHPPLVVAEMSGNHNQDLDRALAIVDAAAQAGAHAIKLQTYTADTMTINVSNKEFFISDKNSLWYGASLYELYQKAHTPWEWHEPIMNRCKEKGILCFSTPFDSTAVDFLETLNVPCYKIASFENADIPLIRKVARTGKPLIISTGMASLSELDESVRAARDEGCQELILLKCTSSYPASPENSNLVTLRHLQELFQCWVGVSDHTLGLGAAIASVGLGSVFIEKHFTLSRQAGSVDAAFSLEPQELQSLVIESQRAWQSLGHVQYGYSAAEIPSIQFRRSLYITQPMQPGDRLTPENLRCIRPGFGLSPKYYDILLGRSVSRSVEKGTPMSWELIS